MNIRPVGIVLLAPTSLLPKATDVLASRQELSQSLEDMLFALAILGDDRAIRATYVAGRKLHERRVL